LALDHTPADQHDEPGERCDRHGSERQVRDVVTAQTGSARNWAGNVTFGAERLHRPSTLDELRRHVASSKHIRALGTGHSFNRIADTPGDLVSVTDLPPRIEIDAERRVVTVSAGVRYGQLTQRLDAAGYALPNLGSLPHISVAGACATATHGSGDRNGNLATAVTAIQLVTASGDLHELSRAADSDRFHGMVVGLGAFGVVTALTLRIVPAFQVRQYVYEHLPRTHLDKHFDEIFASAYSVSLFTDWTEPHMTQVWLKQLAGDDTEPPPPRWMDATLADGPRHPVRGLPTENCTPQLGAAGPWHERLPHFRHEFTPSTGDELQSEYFVPRDRTADALASIDEIRHLIAPVLQISELRTVAADELWLSPSYRRDSVAFHFTWRPEPDRVNAAVEALDDALALYETRPHWGKLFATAPDAIRRRYPRHADFSRLLAEIDPTGKFRNEMIERYFPTL
jgi:xylitol oxidase